MKNKDQFTVIIPTRERANVLGPALRTITAQDYDNLRIIVSDNFSADSTRDVVAAFSDPRITYLNTGKRLSMSHNWEFALSHVDAGWVTIVGDDDGLLPGAVAAASDIARTHDVQAINSRMAAYRWPDRTKHPNGKLSIPRGDGIVIHDSATALRDVCQGRMPYAALPMLYTGGFVDSTLIKHAKKLSGAFYHSLNPDVYSAIVFTKLTDRYVTCRRPLTIGGTSEHSVGTSYMSKKTSSEEQQTPAGRFISEPNIPFHPSLLPGEGNTFPPSIELFTYESILQAEIIPPSCRSLTNHAEQLALILGKAKRRHRPGIEQWAERFAATHALDLAAIHRHANGIRIRDKLAKFLRSFNRTNRAMQVSGTDESPIPDVYAASLIVDRILNGR